MLSIVNALVPGGGKAGPASGGTVNNNIGFLSDLDKTVVINLQTSLNTFSDNFGMSNIILSQSAEFLVMGSNDST